MSRARSSDGHHRPARWRGGMGVVYAAYDPQLDRKVALKLVWRGANGARPSAEQLAREAHTLARVAHPNVVALHDVGRHGDRVYLVMEFVAGVTFRCWLTQAERSVDEILSVARDVAAGLSAAHHAKVIHCDIKPENIMVDATGRARITDFGLARDRDSIGVAGTLSYMAPEQISGRRVGPRSDQFAFAVTLMEAFTGRRPFLATNAREMLEEIGRGVRVMRRPLGRRLPPRLGKVLSRALHADPAERFASVDEFLVALAPRRSAVWRTALALSLLAVGLSVAVFFVERRRAAALRVCAGAERRLDGVWDAPRRAAIGRAFDALPVPYAVTVWDTTRTMLDAYAASWVSAYTQSCEATRLSKVQSEAAMESRIGCLEDRRRELDAFTTELSHPNAAAAQQAVQAAFAMVAPATCLEPSAGKPRRVYVDPALNAKAAYLESRLVPLLAQARLGNYDQAAQVLDAAVADARAIGDPRLVASAFQLTQEVYGDCRQYAECQNALFEMLMAADAEGDDTLRAQARWTWPSSPPSLSARCPTPPITRGRRRPSSLAWAPLRTSGANS